MPKRISAIISNSEQHIKPILYRPFDTRWTYYTGRVAWIPLYSSSDADYVSSTCKGNLALCVCRVVKSTCMATRLDNRSKSLTNRYISNRGPANLDYVFPLYLYPNPDELGISTERSLNFKPTFLTALSEALGLPQSAPFNLPEGVSPEEILAYIYAILYSPKYRERYYDFLKYDFPRIPLPQDIEHFRTLAALGQRLIDCHLLRDISPADVAPTGTRVSSGASV